MENKIKDYYKKIYDLESWKGIHVAHLAYTRNLVIVLATASLGFALNFLFKNELFNCEQILLLKISSGLLLVSIFIGLLIAILESENYRLKYKIARTLEKNEDPFDKLPSDIESLQGKCSSLESLNRFLIYQQMILFFASIITLTVVFI